MKVEEGEELPGENQQKFGPRQFIGIPWFVIVPAAIILALVFASLWWRIGIKDAVAVTLGLFTISGIVVGGIWTYYLFVKRRLSYPKMELKQRVQKWDSGSDYFFIRVEMVVKNVGEILFPITRVKLQLYDMRPWPEKLKDLLEKAASSTEYGKCEVKIPSSEKVVKFPVDDPKKRYELEPGESMVLTFDYVIPKKIEMLAVYTFLYSGDGETGWGETSYEEL